MEVQRSSFSNSLYTKNTFFFTPNTMFVYKVNKKKSARVVEINSDGDRALEHKIDSQENPDRHSNLTDGFL